MSLRKLENTAFTCVNCNAFIQPLTNGSFRNHCPECLYSLHLDNIPGDRSSNCKGLMKPVDLIYNGKKGYQLIHKCEKCGRISKNKIATNTVQEDNILSLLGLHHYN